MALTVPTANQLADFMHETFSAEEETWAEAELQRAADLMSIATELTTDPIDELALRVMTDGILDMAMYLFVRSESRSEMYTPFTSERIGSYSYSKAQAQVQAGISTGVALFDTAVDYLVGLREEDHEGVVTGYGEVVFERSDKGPYLKDISDSIDTYAPDSLHVPDNFGW